MAHLFTYIERYRIAKKNEPNNAEMYKILSFCQNSIVMASPVILIMKTRKTVRFILDFGWIHK